MTPESVVLNTYLLHFEVGYHPFPTCKASNHLTVYNGSSLTAIEWAILSFMSHIENIPVLDLTYQKHKWLWDVNQNLDASSILYWRMTFLSNRMW